MKLCRTQYRCTSITTHTPAATIDHAASTPQTVVELEGVFFVKKVVVQCLEAGVGCDVSLGWSGGVDELVKTAEWPQALGEIAVFLNPAPEQASDQTVIATLTGALTAGKWNVWVVADEYVP